MTEFKFIILNKNRNKRYYEGIFFKIPINEFESRYFINLIEKFSNSSSKLLEKKINLKTVETIDKVLNYLSLNYNFEINYELFSIGVLPFSISSLKLKKLKIFFEKDIS